MRQFASHTHVGRVYNNNEDSIGSDDSRGLWLVADGMGGHASGEVASAIVKDTIIDAVDLSLTDAVIAAHRAVASAAAEQEDGRYQGMGSTVVALALQHGGGEIVWVGDSRAYLWRRGAISRISRDHSYVELLRETNAMTEAETRAHPHKNLVTQTLGHGEPVPSRAWVDLQPHDWLMLCSDGLNDELDDSELAEILGASGAPDDAVIRLVDAALARGGRDNISVVIVAVSEDDVPKAWRRVWQRLRAQVWLPAVIGVIAAVALASLLLFSFKHA